MVIDNRQLLGKGNTNWQKIVCSLVALEETRPFVFQTMTLLCRGFLSMDGHLTNLMKAD